MIVKTSLWCDIMIWL